MSNFDIYLFIHISARSLHIISYFLEASQYLGVQLLQY